MLRPSDGSGSEFQVDGPVTAKHRNDDEVDDDDGYEMNSLWFYTNHDGEQSGRVLTEANPGAINLRLICRRLTGDLFAGEVDNIAVSDADRNPVIFTGTAVVQLLSLRQITTGLACQASTQCIAEQAMDRRQ